MAGFAVVGDDFVLGRRPVRLLSGALHYFRVHEAQWGHRLSMLRAMGLNCVETYVPWNLHEPRPGVLRDVGALGRFLNAVGRAGLLAIVRPGPYICAEWENGGLPVWVTGRFGRRVRTRDAGYGAAVERWFGELLPQVVGRQVGRGGPVIMVQVENEYGSYGSDGVYLGWLADLLRRSGVTVPLFTSDGPEDHMLSGGSVPGVLATANFGSGAREAFGVVRRHRPGGPLMCMEFWCGWFGHWGGRAGGAGCGGDGAGVAGDLGVRGVGECVHGARGDEFRGVGGGVRLDAFDEPGAVARVPFGAAGEVGATGLFRGSFEVADVAGVGHAGLELPGWTRGFVWVNGFCLGRYRSVGPDRPLYVPGPVLREGVNEVWVLELEGAGDLFVDLGPGVSAGPGAGGDVSG